MKTPSPPPATICVKPRRGRKPTCWNWRRCPPLEDASWTSKDGQYLRWDYRSGRQLKARMQKRCVLPYHESLRVKLNCIADDLPQLMVSCRPDTVSINESSCYDALPQLPANSVAAVITSPPYANRYDYTRTYALELAWLGYDNRSIGDLRQRLLSATVENRSKREQLSSNHGEALALFDPASGDCRNNRCAGIGQPQWGTAQP